MTIPDVNRTYFHINLVFTIFLCAYLDWELLLKLVSVTSPEASYSGSRLTGLPRKIKDTCADWYNYVQEWHILNSKGMQVISEIANTKIAAGLVCLKYIFLFMLKL